MNNFISQLMRSCIRYIIDSERTSIEKSGVRGRDLACTLISSYPGLSKEKAAQR